MSTIRACPNGHPIGDSDGLCPTCGTLTASDPVPAATDRLPSVPGYRVLGELGHGGMGVVYRAEQIGLKRTVALKMIRNQGLAGPEERASFQREAEAVARLQHANIVQIYAIGAHQGCPYFALEFMDGGDLAKRLRGQPQLPSPRAAATLVETLARAVHAAHQKGIVHRDLKPANILLSADGTPKVADFGLAKMLDGTAAGSRSGQILGTACYMAPEQARGKVREIGPSADVYALGVILYEMLTGRPPFLGETVDVLRQVVEQDPVPPARLQPKVSGDLEAVCLACLHKEPADRFASALHLADDLRRFLNDEPTLVRPTPVWRRIAKWVRRRPARAALLGVSLVALIFFGALIARTIDGARLQHALERAEHLQYLANMNAAHRANQPQDVLFARDLLDRYHTHAPGEPDRRGFEWYYLWQLRHAPLRTLRGHDGAVLAVAFNHDGQRLVTGGADGTARVWNAQTGAEMWKFAGRAGRVEAVAFSPDDTLVALTSADGPARILDAKLGAEPRSLAGGAGAAHCVAFSPDGQWLACGGDGLVRVWELATGKLHCDLPGLQVRALAFNPTSKELISGGADGALRFWDLTKKEETKALKLPRPDERVRGRPPSAIRSLRFSADGAHVAWTDDLGTATIWELRLPKENAIPLKGHAGAVSGVAFGPRGQVVTGGADWTVRIRDAIGKQEWAFAGHHDSVVDIAFSPPERGGLASARPDRLASASADGTVKIWQVGLDRPLAVEPEAKLKADVKLATLVAVVGGLSAQTDAELAAALAVAGLSAEGDSQLATFTFDGAGDRLVSAHVDGFVRTWEIASGKEQPDLAARHGAEAGALAFGADGKTFAAGYKDGTIKSWQRPGVGTPFSMDGDGNAVSMLALSRDGERVASANDISVTVRDKSGKIVRLKNREKAGSVECLAFSPDGAFLAVGRSDMNVRLWRLVDEKETELGFQHTTPVAAIAFSPDGRRLATGGEDGSVHLWDTGTRQEILVLFHDVSFNNRVSALAFSHDGKRLAAAAGANRRINVWDCTLAEDELASAGINQR